MAGDRKRLTDAQYVKQRIERMRPERERMRAHWRDLSDWIQPRRGRWLDKNPNNGSKRHQNIINNTATLAHRTLAAGMMAGMTPKSRPWFRLTTQDQDLAGFSTVKDWLYEVDRAMRQVFARSNVYASLQMIYADIACFHTAAAAFTKTGDEKVIKGDVFPAGQYYLASSDGQRADVLAVEVKMTIQQIVNNFLPNNISPDTMRAYRQYEFDRWVDVIQLIEPNTKDMPSLYEYQRLPYRSLWLEATRSDLEKLLRVGGFSVNPVVAPRWGRQTSDVYGTMGPAMDSLGDIKALQVLERTYAQAAQMSAVPPTSWPQGSRKGQPMKPGSYHEHASEGQAAAPIYMPNTNLAHLTTQIERHEDRIQRTFYADLFLAMLNSTRRTMTAREVDERHEEKLLALGPVVEALQEDLLDPLIDIAFSYMLDAGMLPEIPQELEGVDLKVEYQSLLSQAQRIIGTGSMEAVLGFVSASASLNPNVTDKLNYDAAVDEYAELVGAAPSMLNDEDTVAAMREARQRAEQARVLNETVNRSNVLDRPDIGDLVNQVTGA